jgi:hypothetical protein
MSSERKPMATMKVPDFKNEEALHSVEVTTVTPDPFINTSQQAEADMVNRVSAGVSLGDVAPGPEDRVGYVPSRDNKKKEASDTRVEPKLNEGGENSEDEDESLIKKRKNEAFAKLSKEQQEKVLKDLQEILKGAPERRPDETLHWDLKNGGTISDFGDRVIINKATEKELIKAVVLMALNKGWSTVELDGASDKLSKKIAEELAVYGINTGSVMASIEAKGSEYGEDKVSSDKSEPSHDDFAP